MVQDRQAMRSARHPRTSSPGALVGVEAGRYQVLATLVWKSDMHLGRNDLSLRRIGVSDDGESR
eukprot:1577388-Prorocentrum_lima.AAC.1